MGVEVGARELELELEFRNESFGRRVLEGEFQVWSERVNPCPVWCDCSCCCPYVHQGSQGTKQSSSWSSSGSFRSLFLLRY